MKELEARLGVQLLRRTTPHVAPTLDGKGYYQQCLRLLADLDDAEAALRMRSRGASTSTARWLVHWVLPKLPQFLTRHPGIDMVFSEATATSTCCAKASTACSGSATFRTAT